MLKIFSVFLRVQEAECVPGGGPAPVPAEALPRAGRGRRGQGGRHTQPQDHAGRGRTHSAPQKLKCKNRQDIKPGVLQVYSQTAYVAKYLAVSLKFAELNPGVKMYHILMQVG